MITKFSKTDLGCVIGDQWVIFGNRIRESDDGLYLTGNGEPEKVLPFPFTLEQFRAFCERRPDFLWEAIESVFTNDDGSLDDAAIDRLNSASGAADLVRAILAVHDAEFQKAWGIHEELAGVDDQIQVLKGLQPSTITEVAEKTKMLAELETKRSSLLRLIDGVPVPATAQDELALPQAAPNPEPASAEQVSPKQVADMPRQRKKRKTWKDAAWGYVVQVQREGRYRTCKALFNALEDNGSEQGVPIIKGVGDKHRGRLFVVELGYSIELQTLRNAWPEIREAAEGE